METGVLVLGIGSSSAKALAYGQPLQPVLSHVDARSAAWVERVRRWVALCDYLYLRRFGDFCTRYGLAAWTDLLDLHTLQWGRPLLGWLELGPDPQHHTPYRQAFERQQKLYCALMVQELF